jgi:hypothetical protein
MGKYNRGVGVEAIEFQNVFSQNQPKYSEDEAAQMITRICRKWLMDRKRINI